MQIEMLNPNALATLAAGKAHNDGGGLSLVVGRAGEGAHWQFRFTWKGKQAKKSLGSLEERSIEEARELAHKYRRMVRDGIDPREDIIVGVSAQGSPVFRDFAQRVFDGFKAGFKNDKSRACWQRSIDTHFAPLHAKHLHQITDEDVVAVLLPIWTAKPGLARECRQRLERIFDAGKRHMAQGNVAELKVLKAWLPKQKRKGQVRGKHAALNYRDMPQFWVELRAIETISSKCLQFKILSCTRTSEVLQMAFDQVRDYKHEKGAKHWTIPGPAMKNDLPADVPMTPVMLEIVAEMRALLDARGCEKETLVFPGIGAEAGEYGVEMGERTLLQLVQKIMAYDGSDKPKITAHGFRASFRSWGMNTKGHDRETLEYCLHHLEAGEHEASYMREDMFDKRRAALLDWERFVTSGERAGDARHVVKFAA
jgi:integrase